MKKLIAALIALFIAGPAMAQVFPPMDFYTAARGLYLVDPTTGKFYGSSGAPAGIPTSDAANAPYTFSPSGGVAEGSSAAAYTFTNTAQRGWYATCPAGTVGLSGSATANGVLVTLTGPNSGTKQVYLADGNNGPYSERITAFSGNAVQGSNPAGCYIGLEF